MNAIVKKILMMLLPALIGSGVTIAISDGLSINCKPVINNNLGGEKYETP